MSSLSLSENRIYKSISTVTTDTESESWTLGDGVEINIFEMGLSSSGSSDVCVTIMWGTEILFSTYGEMKRECDIKLTGDGEKKLVIKMDNQSDSAKIMGGYYRYEENV